MSDSNPQTVAEGFTTALLALPSATQVHRLAGFFLPTERPSTNYWGMLWQANIHYLSWVPNLGQCKGAKPKIETIQTELKDITNARVTFNFECVAYLISTASGPGQEYLSTQVTSDRLSFQLQKADGKWYLKFGSVRPY
ncbi:MAG: hypothetical protein ACR2OO_06820 [Thermomicrobiales bacterium]